MTKKNTIKNNAAPEQQKSNEFENFHILSPGRLVAKRFFRSKLSIAGLVVLALVLLFTLVGPVIIDMIDNTGYGYGLTKEKQAYLKAIENGEPVPEGLDAGTWKTVSPEIRMYQISRTGPMLTLAYFMGPDGQKYQFYDLSVSTATNLAAPSEEHLLGTDVNGLDVFVRLMYGGRMSLMIAFVVIILETLLGVVLGLLAGYYGKWVDQIIMRIVDVFNCLPTLPILLVLSSIIIGIKSIAPSDRIYWLMGALTLMGWAYTARLVRGQILLLREQEYMMAAEAAGLPTRRKIFTHLLPNVLPQIIVTATMGLGSIIIYESTLSYLGLGVQFPYAAWGTMIAQADPSRGQNILANYPNLWIPAGLLILATVLAFNFVGDGLRDAFDPKARR